MKSVLSRVGATLFTITLCSSGLRAQNPIAVFIDQPGTRSGPLFGTTLFQGWAIDRSAAITGITASVDGVLIGNANYGLNRGDVCAAYGNVPGCPYVGWSLLVDTTQFANGTHTLTIGAASAAANYITASSSFVVANWTATSNPIRIVIDQPGAQTPVSGTIPMGGWAIDDTAAISTIAISVDGIPHGAAAYGVSRQDVCAVYPGRPGCPSVGWTASLDTTTLPDGAHVLAVTATSTTGQNAVVVANFTVANLTGSNPFQIVVDQPNTHSGSLSGTVALAGWAFDKGSTVKQVAVMVDGTVYGNAAYGGSRPDVCTAYAQASGCLNVGWNYSLDTTQFADGSHTLEISALAANGQRATIASSFSVSNSGAPSPLHLFIDSPGPDGSTFMGPVTFSGWAVDTTSAISSVQLIVDGAPYGKASYGTSRPDVCAAFPTGANCPNVGWSLAIDTTLLVNGTHTLETVATASNGQHATAGGTFRVANGSALNPMRINIDIPGAQSGPFAGIANIGGWALDDETSVMSVAVAVDGVSYGNASYGISRPDVCSAFPGRAGCPNVGWQFALDTTTLANGSHVLEIAAMSQGGQRTAVSAAFSVANSITLIVDIPNAQSPPLSGTTSLGGWSIASNAAIASVGVSIDGVSFGNALYGVSRQDVCLAYPGSRGCPNVGWTFSLDTTLLDNGPHTLVVTAASAAGQQASIRVPFVVNQPQVTALAAAAAGRILEQGTWGPTPAALE
ncbi:MAG: hypothetical protein JO091_02985, partial [Acidobacteriaceae bacterium]|nr:hypothetical protein [Acidobacteriaceae bacterium]